MITVEQAAKQLKISARRVRALIAAGRIKAEKMGRDWIITDVSGAKTRTPGNPNFLRRRS